MSRGKTVSLLLFASMIFGGQALAWGPEGHAIIAEIAEARLEPAARAQIAQLLSLDASHAQHLDQIASWPDTVRPFRPETAPWHFVDIPLTAPAYDVNRDCVGGNCVVAQIQRFAAVLGDRNAAPQDRLEALKFLVHFVGDVHQPLHCETDLTNFPPPQGDRGGNDIHLTYFSHRSTNLHAVWDGGVIEEALHVHLGPHFTPDLSATAAEAANLNQAISNNHLAAWAPDGLAANLPVATVQWANESHSLARTAYQNLPAVRQQGWDQTYQGPAWQIIQQLARGGVRLAKLLNEELR
jgi:S1/P1 Nuclease